MLGSLLAALLLSFRCGILLRPYFQIRLFLFPVLMFFSFMCFPDLCFSRILPGGFLGKIGGYR